MTRGDALSPAHEDEFSLWLAACDERLAAGATVASLDEVGAPSALRPRLESRSSVVSTGSPDLASHVDSGAESGRDDASGSRPARCSDTDRIGPVRRSP